MKFELGTQAKDIVTGQKGMLMGYVRYLTGCNQYLMAPPVDKEGKRIESVWFDESRIRAVGKAKPLVLDPEKELATGPCESAPTI